MIDLEYINNQTGFTLDELEVMRRDEMKKTKDTNIKIKIKYFSKDINKIEKIAKGDWIDLRSSETITLKQGDSFKIHLGVGMILPDGYEAHVAPRSSTFKTWGIIQTNGVGVIDNSYSGDGDEWAMGVYATRDTVIKLNDKVCQFRIIEKQPNFEFEEVEKLGDINRGGFGTTGVQ